jgi:hypothetical protein
MDSVFLPNTPEIEEDARRFAQQITRRRRLLRSGIAQRIAQQSRAEAARDARAYLTSVYVGFAQQQQQRQQHQQPQQQDTDSVFRAALSVGAVRRKHEP